MRSKIAGDRKRNRKRRDFPTASSNELGVPESRKEALSVKWYFLVTSCRSREVVKGRSHNEARPEPGDDAGKWGKRIKNVNFGDLSEKKKWRKCGGNKKNRRYVID